MVDSLSCYQVTAVNREISYHFRFVLACRQRKSAPLFFLGKRQISTEMRLNVKRCESQGAKDKRSGEEEEKWFYNLGKVIYKLTRGC